MKLSDYYSIRHVEPVNSSDDLVTQANEYFAFVIKQNTNAQGTDVDLQGSILKNIRKPIPMSMKGFVCFLNESKDSLDKKVAEMEKGYDTLKKIESIIEAYQLDNLANGTFENVF